MILKEIVEIIWVSIKVSGTSVLIASLISVPVALFLVGLEFRGKRFFLLLNQTLMSAPTVVIGLVLYSLISRTGPLGRFGLLFTPTAMVIGQVVLILPIVTGFSYTALAQVDKKARLTALSLGASQAQASWIVLNEARSGLVFAILAGFARAISEVGISMMLGGNIRGYTRNITTTIALETAKGEFEKAVILGVVLLFTTLGINLMINLGLQSRS